MYILRRGIPATSLLFAFEFVILTHLAPNAAFNTTLSAEIVFQNNSAPQTAPAYSSQPHGPPGTYWSLQRPNQPPLPGNPYPGLPVYEIDPTNHVYLIDDSSVDYSALAESMAMDQLSLQSESGFALMSLSEGSGGEPGMFAAVYSTEDLWLEFQGFNPANCSGRFVIHPPESELDGVYDLFSTTNLNPLAAGLNGTNWQWVLRCSPGQTNLAVPDLTAKECYFRLGRTNDTDGDWLSDAFEQLVSHTDLANPDQNTNGIPDGWEWNHFGDLNQTAAGDYDGDGVNNGSEYANHTDPNTVVFSLSTTNLYGNAASRWMQLKLRRGVPASVATLVDDTNIASTNWTAYNSSNIAVNLGSTDGWHQVRIGLRGRLTTSQQGWETIRVKLDTAPPRIAITNPVATTISQPWIQLQGYSSEVLRSISYDLTNAAGGIANQPAFVLSQRHDTNTWELSTNYFQAFDLDLTNGINTVTLRATDRAGNVTITNFGFLVDYSSDTNPPAINLQWPRDGMRISGSNCTWRGFVDDPTVRIEATVMGASAGTNSMTGIVERDGTFWVENVPLDDGTNFLTLTATDAAGNVATTNIAVVNLSTALTIDPVTGGALASDAGMVYGTIGLSNYTVWVNGRRAVETNGTWMVNALFGLGGTLLLKVTAIANSDNDGNGSGGGSGENPESESSVSAEWQTDRPSFTYLANYQGNVQSDYTVETTEGPGGGQVAIQTEFDCPSGEDIGGHGSYLFSWWVDSIVRGSMGESVAFNYEWPRTLNEWITLHRRTEYWNLPRNPTSDLIVWDEDTDGNGATQGLLPDAFPGWGIGVSPTTWHDDGGLGLIGQSPGPFSRQITSVLKLQTGGKSVSGKKNLFRLGGSGWQWTYFIVPDAHEPQYLYRTFDAEVVTANPSLGSPSADGGVYVTLPDGAAVDVTPSVGTDKGGPMGVTANKFVLRLWQFTNDIGMVEITDKTRTALVGERILLVCTVHTTDGSPVPPDCTYQWTVPEYAVAGYIANETSATVYANVIKTDPSALFYWVDGGKKEVKCEIAIGGARAKVTAAFDVVRPNVTWTLTPKDQVAVDTNILNPPFSNAGYYHLRTGQNRSTNDVGMLYEFQATDNYDYGQGWKFQFVQVATIDWKLNMNLETTNPSKFVEMRGVDTHYPNKSWESRSGYTTDNPYDVLLEHIAFDWRKDDFECYLMFQPAGGIPVPLKLAKWNWYGRAQRLTTNTPPKFVGITPYIHPKSAIGAECYAFPEWTNNTANADWTWQSFWFATP